MVNSEKNVSMNVTIQKNTMKATIIITAAAVLGAVAVWFINAQLYLPLYLSNDILSLVFNWALTIIAPVVLSLSAAAILFSFIKATFKRFMLSSGVVALAVGAYLNLNFFDNMSNDYYWFLGDANLNTAIFYSVLIHLAFAAVIFAVSLIFFKPVIKRLTINK